MPAECPVCRRPLPPHEPGRRSPRPFCSERCRQVDLGRWLAGDYVIPGKERPAEEEDGESPSPAP
jgi:endogenous inhibitor of DNA gyrase (YacG/DUF329 family)